MLRTAETALRTAQALLDATSGVRWARLPVDGQRERRILLLHAHLAWAKIDQGWKKVAGQSGEAAARGLQEGREHERHGSAVEEHRQGHEPGNPAHEEELPAPW